MSLMLAHIIQCQLEWTDSERCIPILSSFVLSLSIVTAIEALRIWLCLMLTHIMQSVSRSKLTVKDVHVYSYSLNILILLLCICIATNHDIYLPLVCVYAYIYYPFSSQIFHFFCLSFRFGMFHILQPFFIFRSAIIKPSNVLFCLILFHLRTLWTCFV